MCLSEPELPIGEVAGTLVHQNIVNVCLDVLLFFNLKADVEGSVALNANIAQQVHLVKHRSASASPAVWAQFGSGGL